MKINKYVIIICSLIFCFSCILCSCGNNETVNDKVEENEVVSMNENNKQENKEIEDIVLPDGFWKYRYEVENLKEYEAEKNIISEYGDNTKNTSLRLKSINDGINIQDELTIILKNDEISGKRIQYNGDYFWETEFLKELTRKSFDNGDDENLTEDNKKLREESTEIYLECLFDGLNKEYINIGTSELFKLNTDMTLANNTKLLKLFSLYDSSLTYVDGNKYVLKLNKEIINKELNIIYEELKLGNTEVLYSFTESLYELQYFLMNYKKVGDYTFTEVIQCCENFNDGALELDLLQKELSDGNSLIQLYFNELLNVFPDFEVISTVIVEDNIYNCKTTIDVQNKDLGRFYGVTEEKYILKVEDKIDKPNNFNTFEEFSKSPYMAFSQGNMQPLLDAVNKKVNEKYSN